MIKIDTSAFSEEKVPLVEIDGVVYEIPAEANAALGLKFLLDEREVGLRKAEGLMLESLLGEEAYRGLANSKITPKQLSDIMKEVQRITQGELEAEEGNG